jgi:hypothetical protein
MDVARISAQHLRQYLSYLLTEYTPRRLIGRNEEKLSPKTVRNVWVTLSAFFQSYPEFGIRLAPVWSKVAGNVSRIASVVGDALES